MHLDSAGIRVTDLDRSLAYCRGPLDPGELRRGTREHGGVWVLLEDPKSHQRLELNWYPKGSRYDRPFVAGEGLDHVGFRARDIRSIDRDLVAAGGREVDAISEAGVEELICVEDPDGNWIELIRDERA
jgi:catechol 2,3-dioxygenase-like lactoylglutathione lyase family enzyme